jgi:hypothetical protein
VIVAPGPQRWGRVEEIFHQALEQPPESRDARLDQTCGGDAELRAEVASLLDSDGAAREGFVGEKVQHAFQNLVADDAAKSAMEGRRVGSWRLVREIGGGGMGAVYLAVRADQQYESSVPSNWCGRAWTWIPLRAASAASGRSWRASTTPTSRACSTEGPPRKAFLTW